MIRSTSIYLTLIFSVFLTEFGPGAADDDAASDDADAGMEKTGKTFAFNRHNYYVRFDEASWTNAQSDCKSSFGKYAGLAEIQSKEEWEGIKKLLDEIGRGQKYWVGGMYHTSGYWYWPETFVDIPEGSWVPWAPGYPKYVRQHRVLVNFNSLYKTTWTTEYNSFTHKYICEVHDELIESENNADDEENSNEDEEHGDEDEEHGDEDEEHGEDEEHSHEEEPEGEGDHEEHEE